MKSIKATLSQDLTSLEIIPLADLHLGDKQCDLAKIRSKIDYIKNNENVYCILNGDIMNNSTKTSIGDIYSEELKPMDQLKLATELFEPIKDKILGITSGNHEFRTWKQDGIDLTKLLCNQLGIEDKYSEASLLIFLRFGKENRNRKESNNKNKVRMIEYTLFVNHGSGGGRKEGAKAIRLADMASIVDADIYIHSHTHLPMVMKQSFYRTDPRNSTFALVPKLFVNTSAFLNYGGYGDAQEFKPASTDTPHIYLNGLIKEMQSKL